MSEYSVRRFVDGRLVGEMPPLPASPWKRELVLDDSAQPPRTNHTSLAERHGVYKLGIGSSVVVPFNNEVVATVRDRILLVLRRRKMAWPERYTTSVVAEGIKITRTV